MDEIEVDFLDSREYLLEYENLQYLFSTKIEVYLKDAVCIYLSHRSQGQSTEMNLFFKDYFDSVDQGTHVIFRDYKFASSTLYNQLCSIKLLIAKYKILLTDQNKMSAEDVYCLVEILWKNVPMATIKYIFETENDTYLTFLEFVMRAKDLICLKDMHFKSKEVEDEIEEILSEICPERKENKSPVALSETTNESYVTSSGSDTM